MTRRDLTNIRKRKGPRARGTQCENAKGVANVRRSLARATSLADETAWLPLGEPREGLHSDDGALAQLGEVGGADVGAGALHARDHVDEDLADALATCLQVDLARRDPLAEEA